MNDQEMLNIVLEAGAARRDDRRRFLRQASGVAIAAGGASLLAACGSDDSTTATPTPTASTVSPTPTSTASAAISDADVLNFALNLEYLEAQFYSIAATGAYLAATDITDGAGGAGGTVTGGRAVTFTDPLVQQYAREIAADELAHVRFLRSALGTARVGMPNIDISASGAFFQAAAAAGVATPATPFDPYASDENFLLGAYIFEDVGVTAYKGASIILTSKVFLEAAAGILAAEAYHAGLIRTTLYRKGIATPTTGIVDAAGRISDARDSLDGGLDLDQGIVGTNPNTASAVSNIVPTDSDGIAFSRSAGQVLNIAYLNRSAVVGGGFFPNGVNGNVRSSAAS